MKENDLDERIWSSLIKYVNCNDIGYTIMLKISLLNKEYFGRFRKRIKKEIFLENCVITMKYSKIKNSYVLLITFT